MTTDDNKNLFTDLARQLFHDIDGDGERGAAAIRELLQITPAKLFPFVDRFRETQWNEGVRNLPLPDSQPAREHLGAVEAHGEPVIMVCTCGATQIYNYSTAHQDWVPSSYGVHHWLNGAEGRHATPDDRMMTGTEHFHAGYITAREIRWLGDMSAADLLWTAIQGQWQDFTWTDVGGGKFSARNISFRSGVSAQPILLQSPTVWHGAARQTRQSPGLPMMPTSLLGRAAFRQMRNNIVAARRGDSEINYPVERIGQIFDPIAIACREAVVDLSRAVDHARTIDELLYTPEDDLPAGVLGVPLAGLVQAGEPGPVVNPIPGQPITAGYIPGSSSHGSLMADAVVQRTGSQELTADALIVNSESQEVAVSETPAALNGLIQRMLNDPVTPESADHVVEGRGVIVIVMPDGQCMFGSPEGFGAQFKTDANDVGDDPESIVTSGGRVGIDLTSEFGAGDITYSHELWDAIEYLSRHTSLKVPEQEKEPGPADEWDLEFGEE